MGISRENGYSASVESFLVAGGQFYRLAKTNGVTFILDEPCELPPGTEAKLLIIVDGHEAYKSVVLPDGVTISRPRVRYQEALPF